MSVKTRAPLGWSNTARAAGVITHAMRADSDEVRQITAEAIQLATKTKPARGLKARLAPK